MNSSPQPSRTELIQRLADGELSETERKELLQKIDDETPERWRDVALCLLGNRFIAQGLRQNEPSPATNVIVFPVWKRLSALAAVLALGLGLGFLVPRQRDAGGNVPVFANLDEFKKAVSEAVQDSELGDSVQNLLAANLSSGSGGPHPFAEAPIDIPRPTPGPHPTRPRPEPEVVAAPRDVESKVDEIQKNVADIRRLLQAMQDRK